jgi:hypothetical protein
MTTISKGDGNVLVAAIALRMRGFWVHLIHPGDKRPIGNGWGLTRWDEDKLRETAQRYPAAGVGIALGPIRAPGGGWLVDLEIDGQEGEGSLGTFLGGPCPETPIWRSARGDHTLFVVDGHRLQKLLIAAGAEEGKDERGKGSWHLAELPGLELRTGGYKSNGAVKQVQSVVPPTVGTDGQPRKWRVRPTVLVADLPEAAYTFLEAIAGQKVAVNGNGKLKADPAKPKLKVPGKQDAVSAYAARALEEECRAVKDEPEGGRNKRLNVAAFNLGQFVGARALLRSEVEKSLTEVAKRAGLGETETRNTIRSGLDAGEKEPRDLSDVGTRGYRPSSNGHGHHHENGSTGGEIEDNRPEILISHEEHRNVDEAVAALKAEPLLFQRGGSLVTILADCKPKPKRHDPTRPTGSLRIALLPNAQIRRLMTVHARWVKFRKDDLVPAHPPATIVDEVATLGSWSGIRPIEGITETPTLRPDGSLISKPGYDEETGLWFAPNGEFPGIPDRPTKEQAEAARDELYGLVEDFPFAKPEHQATWLAALLTPMARWAIDGPCPLFLFDANCPGTGKSKLCDIIAILITGREMPRGSYPDDQDELQKMLLSVAMAADRLLLFDNVPTGFSIGGSALDRALTARTMKGRILGRSQMTPELPVDVVFFATGNNLGLRGDSLRRVVPCRLETAEERPEERKDFKIKGDLLAHVKQGRGQLVSAALTILRAYIVAGRPDQNLKPMDYPAWCGLVRNAVKWATGADPCESRTEMVANDEETNTSKGLIVGWKALCVAQGKAALSVASALETLEADKVSIHADLRAIVCAWSKDGKLPSSQSIGNRLNKIRGRNLDGSCLDCGFSAGVREWFVRPASKQPIGATGATGATVNPSAGKISQSPSAHPVAGEMRQERPATETPVAPVAPSPGKPRRNRMEF